MKKDVVCKPSEMGAARGLNTTAFKRELHRVVAISNKIEHAWGLHANLFEREVAHKPLKNGGCTEVPCNHL